MNLPNKLTIARLLLCPVFLFLALADFLPNHLLWSAVIFAVASLTDMIDGKIARKYNLVTDFGKFLDPIADKILVFSALGVFLVAVPEYWKVYFVWMYLVMIAREFLVTSFRTIAMGKGKVIAADIFGKIKTTLQMFGTLFLLVECNFGFYDLYPVGVGLVLFVASAVFTVISGINYIVKNKEVFQA